jgi:hypothetical protein
VERQKSLSQIGGAISVAKPTNVSARWDAFSRAEQRYLLRKYSRQEEYIRIRTSLVAEAKNQLI